MSKPKISRKAVAESMRNNRIGEVVRDLIESGLKGNKRDEALKWLEARVNMWNSFDELDQKWSALSDHVSGQKSTN
jgi:hypothetical protein